MIGGGLEFIGMDELADDFLDLSTLLQGRVLREATAAGARVARDSVREAAPVDTGFLRANIVSAVAPSRETPGAVTAGVRVRPSKRKRGGGKDESYTPPFYWKFIELGTSKMPAHPFVRRAWDGSLSAIERAVSERLAGAIDKNVMRGRS